MVYPRAEGFQLTDTATFFLSLVSVPVNFKKLLCHFRHCESNYCVSSLVKDEKSWVEWQIPLIEALRKQKQLDPC